MKMTESQQVIWDDFATSSPRTVDRVKTLLNQGENVVVVMSDRVASCYPYRDTTAPIEAAMTLQRELVRQTGVPLPIGNDGHPVFAFLAWKSTDPIDAPSDGGVVGLAGQPTDAMESTLDTLAKLGIATRGKVKNHLFEL